MVSPMKKLESRIRTTNEEEEEVQKEGGRGVCDMKAERLFKARKDQTGWEKTEEGSAVGVEEWQPNEGRSRGENLTRKERSEMVIYSSMGQKVILSSPNTYHALIFPSAAKSWLV